MSTFRLTRFVAVAVCLFIAAAFVLFKSGYVSSADPSSVFVPMIGATKTVAEVPGLSNGDGNADPGETLEYTVTVNNTGGDPALGVAFSDQLTGPQSLVPGSDNILPNARDNSFTGIGNVRLSVPDDSADLLGNDTDFDGGTLTILGFGDSLANANANPPGNGVFTFGSPLFDAQITVNANGSFTFDPPRGFSGVKSFWYTVCDGAVVSNVCQGGTDTAKVDITFNGVIWFVDPTKAANGDGRSATPFNNLPAFNTANANPTNADTSPQNDDAVFLYTGAHVGPLTLRGGQKLIGQGATAALLSITGYAAPSGTSQLPSTGGTRPVITSAGAGITSSLDTVVRGITIGNTGTAKLQGSPVNAIIGNNVSPDVLLEGTGPAINLGGSINNTSGLISVASTSSSTPAIIFTEASGGISLGSVTVSGGSSECIQVSAATIDVNFGNTSCSGGTIGVNLAGNSGGTRTFGTLSISNTTGIAFRHASGGGAVTVTGATTITNPAGVGIDIDGSNANLSFAATTVNKNATGGIGVDLTSNATRTISFTSLTVTTTNAFALNTNNSGTVTNSTAVGSSLTQSGAGGGAASLTNTALGLTFTSVSSTNGANGLIFSGGSGTFASATTNLQNNAGIGLLMSSSAVAANFGNTTVNSSAGDGVDLSSNTGAITFADLDITPDSGLRGLDAQNNTGVITSTSGDISTVNAPAVFIDGPAGRTPLNLRLTGVSANGGANGIVLTDTSSSGSPGGFRVLGNGGTCTLATPTCTGGTIQSSTGVGISLTNATGSFFTRMRILNTGSHGVNGLNTNGFTFSTGVVNGAGDADNESSLYFGTAGSATANLSGTALIENSFINGSEEVGMHVRNESGSLNLRVNNSDFTNSVREDGILFETFGTATITALVENSRFSGMASDGIMANSNAGTLNFTAQNNTFTGCSAGCSEPTGSDNAISVGSAGSANLNYTISGNTMNNSNNSAIILNQNDTSIVHGRILNNTITNTTNGYGIDGTLAADGLPGVGSTVRLLIQGNTISGHRAGGMFFNSNDSSNMHVTIVSNTVSTRPTDTTSFENVTSQSNGASTACTDIRSNTVERGGLNAFGVGADADSTYVYEASTSTHNLERGVSASASPQQVIIDNNPAANGVLADGAIALVNNGTCVEPNATTQPPAAVAAIGSERDGSTGDLGLARFTAISPAAQIFESISKRRNSSAQISAPVATAEIASLDKLSDHAHSPAPGYIDSLIAFASNTYAAVSEIAVSVGAAVSPTVHAEETSTPAFTNENITKPAFTLPANESVTIKFRVTVDAAPYASGVDNITNTANISGSNFTTVTPSSSIPLDAEPDLSVTKTDGGGTTEPGGELSYTLSYSNSATGNANGAAQDAANVVLTETVPANTVFNPSASTTGWTCAPNNNAGSVCTLNVGGVAAGANGSAAFVVNVLSALPAGAAQISNSASVAENPLTNGADRDAANNSGSDTTQIIGNWTGAVSTDWFLNTNWSNNVSPAPGQNVSIPNVVNAPVVSGGNVDVDDLVLNGENMTIDTGATVNVDGTAALGSNVIDGAGTLSLGADASITRSTGGQVNATLVKLFTAAGPFTFPVGTPGEYSPVDVNVTAGTGSLSVRANDGVAPSSNISLNPLMTLQRYWSLSGSGITADVTFNYLDADIAGNENNYRIVRVEGGTASVFGVSPDCPATGIVCVDTATNRLIVRGLKAFSDWTASELNPTSSGVTVSGKVVEEKKGKGKAKEQPIGRAFVTITDPETGMHHQMYTNGSGQFSFDDIPAGKSYIVTVMHDRYLFDDSPAVFDVNDNVTGLTFTGSRP